MSILTTFAFAFLLTAVSSALIGLANHINAEETAKDRPTGWTIIDGEYINFDEAPNEIR